MNPRPKRNLLILFFAIAVALGTAPLPAIDGVTGDGVEVADDLDSIAAGIAADIAAEQGGDVEQYLGYARRLAKTLSALSSDKKERVLRGKAFRVRGDGSSESAPGQTATATGAPVNPADGTTADATDGSNTAPSSP